MIANPATSDATIEESKSVSSAKSAGLPKCRRRLRNRSPDSTLSPTS